MWGLASWHFCLQQGSGHAFTLIFSYTVSSAVDSVIEDTEAVVYAECDLAVLQPTRPHCLLHDWKFSKAYLTW
ncbi:hypothetical protein GDO81_025499 [Engystomops pustulosus]|uniref:Secreted protein n=1 Tax=Engystomops pustulosus TaxID=76066 RepID=A0AAV6YIU3_ENGPU|nr:hypothetical protein GDO81_025499 [Engystomops pustulosus]